MRGIEGDTHRRVISARPGCFLSEKSSFSFDGNNHCPPRDGANALLSFIYSILGKDISGALQGVGWIRRLGFVCRTADA